MTQPPCDEGVYWMVFKQPVEASAAQLQQMTEYLGTNARPVQPLNARTPLKSWPDRQVQESFYLY
jgi:carbonic anhydrase